VAKFPLLGILLTLFGAAYASPPFKLSQGEAEIKYSVKGRAQISVAILNDLRQDLTLKSYSKP
jgi:hypothetical protein